MASKFQHITPLLRQLQNNKPEVT